mmetsp:Transcript_19573/g.24712  ORF Transcript_19573/g.24712 Transcript_19573/m.24712 type:complete len:215 (-) Transcript_19573:33-677(-)
MIHKSWDLTITTTHQTYPGNWNPPKTNNQTGFTIDGTLANIRNHNLEDSNKRRFRFMAVTIDVTKARKREFDGSGKELDTQYQGEVLERKGFLNVYDHVKQEDPFEIPVAELRRQLKGAPAGSGNQVEFWASTSLVKAAEFKKDERLRLKTLGNTHLIETITSMSHEKHGNYYGEDVLNRWDNKIQGFKKVDEHDGEPESSCTTDVPVDDDEWD